MRRQEAWDPFREVEQLGIKVTASFKDGILAVVIERSKAQKAKGIEIAIH